MRALVTGDNGRTTSDLVGYLLEGGFEVVQTDGVQQTISLCQQDQSLAVLLVNSTPRREYLSLCRRVRSRVQAPCVVIDVIGNDDEAVRALDAGADDYIAWPISPRLMEARLGAVVRRSHRVAMDKAIARSGELAIDLVRPRVTMGRKEVSLTPAEFRLLVCLMNNEGLVVPHRLLVKHVQGYDCEEQEAQAIMKVLVRRLRRKIEPDPHHPKYIRSVRGFGYALESQTRWRK